VNGWDDPSIQMSGRSPRIVFSPAAIHDLEEIVRYSLREWGSVRAKRYDSSLRQGILHLAHHPNLGQARPEFGQSIRSFSVESHVVIYEATDTDLIVLRIIHPRQDVAEIMSEPDA